MKFRNELEKENYEYINQEHKDLNEVYTSNLRKHMRVEKGIYETKSKINLLIRKIKISMQQKEYECYLKFNQYGSNCTLEQLQTALGYKDIPKAKKELILDFIRLKMYRTKEAV